MRSEKMRAADQGKTERERTKSRRGKGAHRGKAGETKGKDGLRETKGDDEKETDKTDSRIQAGTWLWP